MALKYSEAEAAAALHPGGRYRVNGSELISFTGPNGENYALRQNEFPDFMGDTNTFVVGQGQEFATISDAIDAVNLLPLLNNPISAVASTAAVVPGGLEIRRLVEDGGGDNWQVFGQGAEVAFILASSAPTLPNYSLGVIEQSSSPTTIYANHGFPSTASSINYTAGIPVRKTILCMPGHEEDITTDLVAAMALPNFTTIKGLVRNTARLTAAGQASVAFNNIGSESGFINMNLNSEVSSFFIQNSGLVFSSNFYLGGCNITNGSVDWMFVGTGFVGGIVMRDCDIKCHFDVFRLSQCREVTLIGNRIDSRADGLGGTTASFMGYGTDTSDANLPFESLNIIGNLITSHNQSILPGTIEAAAYAVELRNGLSSFLVANVIGNKLIVKADNNSTASGFQVSGINIPAGMETNTPSINLGGNVINVVNSGTGTATTLNSEIAAYPIKSAGDNIVVNGVAGNNIVAATLI